MSEQFNKGDRVRHRNDDKSAGTIEEITPITGLCRVKWDDGYSFNYRPDFLVMIERVMIECECGLATPGILWPQFPDDGDDLPYVERCDLCKRYGSDQEAARALVGLLAEVGLRDPIVGEHIHGDGTGIYGTVVFPSPAAILVGGKDWAVYVEAARSSLNLARHSKG